MIERYSTQHEFAEVIPISALSGDGVELLTKKALSFLPEGPPLYPEDEITDQPERVLAAELVREKIIENTDEELPYVTAVITERWEDAPDITRINCAIIVERSSHRAIVLGRGGERLKKIGTDARLAIENIVGRKVFLHLFVKVVADWRNSGRSLDEMGVYE